MLLDCVLTSVNEKELYLDFIPIFVKTWNKLYPNVDVKIILIAKNIPEKLLLYKNNIIIFEPIEDILTSYTSQFIRLLYPCILSYKNGILITDIDILPMNKTYYTKNIIEYDNTKFIYYRDNVCFQDKQIAMCYNIATPKIWKDIFQVESYDDIINNIKKVNKKNIIKKRHGNIGWYIDQITLYNKVIEWNKKTNNFIKLNEKKTGFKRLDRNTFNLSNINIIRNITSGNYTDYHCYRPMKKYSDINWEIFYLLPLNNPYSKLQFIKSKLKSPIGNGLFDIFINTKQHILYKKIRKKINIINIGNYKKIIYSISGDKILHKYIFEPEKIYVEDDGSYYSSFIKNGIRLYDINLNSRIDDIILNNLKKSIQDMKENLNNYVKTKTLSGDWALHNLIYCKDTNKIYNIDIEGFYTYPLIYNNGNCDIKYCNERFDKLLDKLNSKKFVIQINDLVYNSNKNKFIYKSDIHNIEYYISNFLIDNQNYQFTRIIENPVFIINTLDVCYSHAIIDSVFPYFWSLEELNIKNNLIIFIKKDKLIKFPVGKQVINHEKGIYKKSWNDIINLLNPKEIIFEHLLDENTILLFKKSYLYAENNKKLKWQRTFWNCNKNYPGRHIKDVLYNDVIIQSKLNLFIKMVKNKYQIIEKINIIKNLVIIERISNRKFDTNFLSNLDNYCKKIPNLQYNGIQFLENLSFADQIKLFNTNDIIIFKHGSCLTNILWAKQNTIIIELDNQNRESVIKRICDFTKTIQVRYDYNNILNKPNLIFHKIKEITTQDKINDEYFTLILWNPTLFQSQKILQDIPNIIEKKEIVVSKEILHDYIFDIYKLDTRCSHNIVLPPKIKKLKEYNDKHLIVKFKIDNPQYTNNICNQAVKLKEMIRRKYKSYIKNYIKDIMIHVADNFEQSKYIWEKDIDTSNSVKLLVQKAKNPLRYKVSKIEKNGKDGWNTINTMNVYESFLEDTIQFFVYKAPNPRRYCLSKEKITDNNWEYCYDFYCKESEVDRRIPMNIVENSQKYITGNNFKRICDFCINNNKLVPINNNILKPFYGCFIFVRCGQERYFFKNVFNSIKTPFYIVTHNSDSSSPKECYKYLDNDKIIKWYCKNNDYDKYHHKLELIPLGLGNTRDKNILHQIYEKKKSFENKKYPYKCLINSNFSTYNGKTHSRTICYESLKNNSSITILPQRLDYERYLEYILDYGFIISPHRNGLDCTRTWESILFGLIPIVKSSTLDRLYTNLPVMIVNGWDEITLDKLKSFKDNCKINERYDLLYTDFWDNKFKNDRILVDINVKPLQKIFDKLTNYVVLRGHDDLHKRIPLLKNSDDIDILLTEKNDIIKLCGNNIVVINNERIKFDRRYIGDNYYDSKWQQNMIATKVNRHFFYVLDEQNNYYATLYHSLIHKGQIHNKYEKLYKNFENKHKLNSDILSRYYQLLKFMLRNNYTFTRAYDRGVGFFKNKYKLNLFIIRKKGMVREIIENILNQIENEYQILDKILININNKKKFYSNFYGNYDKHKDDIEKNNDNQCLAIITNNPDNINPNELKQKIRKQYIKFYPPSGNIIHCSDSSNDCEKELEMLLDENINTFKNIGTYYSQKSI